MIYMLCALVGPVFGAGTLKRPESAFAAHNGCMFRRVVALLALFVAGLLANVASPAWACGCGAYIPDGPGASVVDERALIAWDGATEDILMSFDIAGGSDAAAWVMPVPTTASVTLGEAEVFTDLTRITAPRVEYRDSWWPTFSWLFNDSAVLDTAGAPGGAVTVLGSRRIGPFDVTRLVSADASALADWLGERGFPHPDGLDENLAPYVADGWEIVAIRLAAAEQGESLTGNLQPLRLSFPSDTVVYPMRLSRSAKTPQSVDLYVLAEHRMDPTTVPVAGETPSLQFAGVVQRAEMSPALADYVDGDAFLTRWKNQIIDPSLIDGDYVFEQASSDSTYQQVIYRTRERGDVTGLILLAGFALTVVVATVVLVRRAARTHAR